MHNVWTGPNSPSRSAVLSNDCVSFATVVHSLVATFGKERDGDQRLNYNKLGNDVSPTTSIRSDDSCKTLERSNSVFSLVGLEILQLQPLKISHFHDTLHGRLLNSASF